MTELSKIWTALLKSVKSITGDVKEYVHTLDPAVVRNNTDHDLHFCVKLKGEEDLQWVTLAPGQSMTEYENVIDVDGYLDQDGIVVKLRGKMAQLATSFESYEGYACRWSLVASENWEHGMNARCQIVDRERFAKKYPDWRTCLDNLPVQLNNDNTPGGGDFSEFRDDSSHSAESFSNKMSSDD